MPRLPQLCTAQYDRTARYREAGISTELLPMQCQMMSGHSGVHSWNAVWVQDNEVIDQHMHRFVPPKPVQQDPDYASPAEQAAVIVSKIDHGDYDPYLESILSAAHDRKRALRSVPGFERRSR